MLWYKPGQGRALSFLEKDRQRWPLPATTTRLACSPSHTQGLCDSSSLLQPLCADLTRSHWMHPPPPKPQVLPALKPILSSLASLTQLVTPGDLDGQLRAFHAHRCPVEEWTEGNPARGLKLGATRIPQSCDLSAFLHDRRWEPHL